MTPTAVNKLVAALHVAAGRDWGAAQEAVYAEALRSVPDDVGEEVMRALIRHVSWDRPPSPAMALEKVNAIMAARKDLVPALPESTARECTPEENRAAIRRIKELHGERLAAKPFGRRLMGAAYRAAKTTTTETEGEGR